MGDPWSRRLARMLNKVPEVTLAFWVIKILSTTVGETGADYLAVHVGLGTAITDGIMLKLLVASLLMQLQRRGSRPADPADPAIPAAGRHADACAVDGGLRICHRCRDRRGAKVA